MAHFTVDTHLFRELGELLVGRDSTALVELIKNAYDADATEVTVSGEGLDSPETGKIIITDNGVGMTPPEFEDGFLRIASRMRTEGNRRSRKYERRFTGAKGVGRLAAHKLARHMEVYSIPDPGASKKDTRAVSASIDWDKIEALKTLDEVEKADAVSVTGEARPKDAASGTIIELTKLRRKWSPEERARFFWEVETFSPPEELISFPESAVDHPLLLKKVRVQDSKKKDPGFSTKLTGDFDVGEEYWQALVNASSWVIEIEASAKEGKVSYAVTPTKSRSRNRELGKADQYRCRIPYPSQGAGLSFQARILVREGSGGFNKNQRAWVGRASGVRVFMEGFRVLPYGEAGDDWLMIDADYTKRQRKLRFLEEFGDLSQDGVEDQDVGLNMLRKEAYFGAAFLTLELAPTLRMLVNREGFVPDAALDTLRKFVRIGIDLSVRHRASQNLPNREARRTRRDASQGSGTEQSVSRSQLRQAVAEAVTKAANYAEEAKQVAASGDITAAAKLIEKASAALGKGSESNERLISERSIMQILAAVGLQMASFVHEINGLLGMANSLENAVDEIRKYKQLSAEVREMLGRLHASLGDLRRVVERQASYLVDITSPDARRRRSRQKLAERFSAATNLIIPAAARRQIKIENDIPDDIKSPPMFPAETILVLSNLLTNAIKAAGQHGRIRATGESSDSKGTVLRVQNTGVEVDLAEGEKWFRPFESTTTEVDPILGQGMGMGLPIARNILEEYGATIRFAKPSRGFSTCIEIVFP